MYVMGNVFRLPEYRHLNVWESLLAEGTVDEYGKKTDGELREIIDLNSRPFEGNLAMRVGAAFFSFLVFDPRKPDIAAARLVLRMRAENPEWGSEVDSHKDVERRVAGIVNDVPSASESCCDDCGDSYGR